MRANAGLLGIVVVSMAVFVALFAGLVSALLPWWLALLLFAPPIILWAGAKWPLVAMMVALLTAYGFLPVGLRMTDVIVMSFVFFMLYVYRRQVAYVFVNFKTIWLTLALLMTWGLLMTVYGFAYRGNFISYVYEESVSVAYWLLMVPIILLGYDKKRSAYTMYALMTVSVLLSFVALIQSVAGVRLNFSGLAGVAELTSEQGGIAGLARSNIPGILLIIFTFVIAVLNIISATGKRKFLWSLLLILNLMAIFVTFGRTSWSVTLIATFLAAALAGRKDFTRFALIGGLFFVSLLFVLSLTKPEFVEGAVNRMLSIQDEFTSKGTSWKWRMIENHFAYISIHNNPLIGIGLGGEYKPRLTDFRVFTSQTHYIHNGYLFVIVKMGFIGLFLYLLHYLNIAYTCWKSKNAAGVDKAPQIALVALYTGTLILNVPQPEFMQGPSIASLASIAAVVLSLGRWQRTQDPAQTKI